MSRPRGWSSAVNRRLMVLFAVLALSAVVVAGCGRDSGGQRADQGDADLAQRGKDTVLTPESVDQKVAAEQARVKAAKSGARAVKLEGAGQKAVYDEGGDGVSPGAPSDAQVRADVKQADAQLKKFRRALANGSFLQTGPRAKVLPDGTAVAPEDAPEEVKRVIQAGNLISKFPYKWGGGHGAWRDNGYDCSGSVSFALAGAGLVKSPLTSGLFERWGEEGQGAWITVFANPGHVYMYVAGLRFDTSGRAGVDGTRWQEAKRTNAGFVMRHPAGL